MTTKERVKRLTRAEFLVIADKVREVCKKNAAGHAIYDAGWSDDLVSKICSKVLGKELNAKHTGDVRREIIGHTHQQRETKMGLADRITALEEWATRTDPAWSQKTLV